MPPSPPKKSGKLPTWAYIAAGGIGLLVAFFLLRSPKTSAASQTPADYTGSPGGSNQDLYNLTQWLQTLLASGNTGTGVPGGSTGGAPNGSPASECVSHGDVGPQPCPKCASGFACVVHNGPDACCPGP